MRISEAVEKLRKGEDMTRPEARAVMEQLFSGAVPDEQIMSFLVALRDKGETAEELVGFAEVMRARAAEGLRAAGVDLDAISRDGPLLDTCGTGGDGLGTFNVSTATALVAAAAGVRVAKHGNRSISSRCGSADVLEALGVIIDLPLERVAECLNRVGMVFLFAPKLHLSMKHVMNARRALKTKTVFNLLGPLTNPLSASVQLAGVYDRARTEMMAQALEAVGVSRAMVVASHDGLDEISTSGPTQMSETEGWGVTTRDVAPEDFGVARAAPADFRGGEAAENAALLRRVLEGERGPLRDLVLANASAALVAAGVVADFRAGADQAAAVIDSHAALKTLEKLVEVTQGLAR
jgi:anthranilate phosphoribosyltransferase